MSSKWRKGAPKNAIAPRMPCRSTRLRAILKHDPLLVLPAKRRGGHGARDDGRPAVFAGRRDACARERPSDPYRRVSPRGRMLPRLLRRQSVRQQLHSGLEDLPQRSRLRVQRSGDLRRLVDPVTARPRPSTFGEVHGKGLEPLRLSAVEPKSTASANFATRAGVRHVCRDDGRDARALAAAVRRPTSDVTERRSCVAPSAASPARPRRGRASTPAR